MKCKFCKKHIDDVDCSCNMCMICGWPIDPNKPDPKTTLDQKNVIK